MCKRDSKFFGYLFGKHPELITGILVGHLWRAHPETIDVYHRAILSLLFFGDRSRHSFRANQSVFLLAERNEHNCLVGHHVSKGFVEVGYRHDPGPVIDRPTTIVDFIVMSSHDDLLLGDTFLSNYNILNVLELLNDDFR